MRLEWVSPYEGNVPIRVWQGTCSCRQPVYELCLSGGRAFIRKTTTVVAGEMRAVSVRESPRWGVKYARETWAELLAGHAR